MPLANMKDMLNDAYHNGYAIGAFDLVNMEFLYGIMEAAERTQSPVILSLAESHFEYFDFELIMPAVEAAARTATVPVAIHLDHGASNDSAIQAINLGCNGVMVDASQLPFQANCHATRQVVDMAHGCGVPVEGELGYVPGVEGEDAQRHPGQIAYTTVDDAKRYVEITGVDFLAVSIGTVHGRMQGEPRLDFQRLEEINKTLNIPLVIHGGTGLGDDQFRQLIRNGVSKINYYTALSDAAGRKVQENTRDELQPYTSIIHGVKDAISEEVERCMNVWGSAGKAQQVLEYSAPWMPVEHVIIYNVSGINQQDTHNMMAEGKKQLGAIPGVRDVITGYAVKDGAQYQYSWLVRFCHPAVIDSYREHPTHVTFADNIFRPVADGRISIDYQAM